MACVKKSVCQLRSMNWLSRTKVISLQSGHHSLFFNACISIPLLQSRQTENSATS